MRKDETRTKNIATGETSLFLYVFYFYVYSYFFGSYQLNGKYNTHTDGHYHF